MSVKKWINPSCENMLTTAVKEVYVTYAKQKIQTMHSFLGISPWFRPSSDKREF